MPFPITKASIKGSIDRLTTDFIRSISISSGALMWGSVIGATRKAYLVAYAPGSSSTEADLDAQNISAAQSGTPPDLSLIHI